MTAAKASALQKAAYLALNACCLVLLEFLFALALYAPACAETLAGGSAADGIVVVESEITETYVADSSGTPVDPEILFNAYAEKRLQDSLPKKAIISTQTVPSPNLSVVEQRLLDELKTRVADVARFNTDGDEMSTVFEIPLSSLGVSEVTWTPDELGVSPNLESGKIPESTIQAAKEKGGLPDIGKVLKVLCADCPFEQYWYDKTASAQYSYGIYYTHYDSSPNQWAKLIWRGPLFVYMPVCAGYCGSTEYTVSNQNAIRITTAINTAEAIVGEGVGKGLEERLAFYKDEICNRVTYNSTAAGSEVPFGDPWQLISVFDGDDSTNVVCEGYSKAFQYLFDLTKFENASCYLVTGDMKGGTGAGKHMWNVVRMNGQSFLADVTNSDADTVGASGELFLASNPHGNIDDGYRFLEEQGIEDSGVLYVYDDDTCQLYSDTILMICGAVEKTSLAAAEVVISGTYEYNGSPQEPAQTEVSVSCNGSLLVYDQDYTYYASNNTYAGTATLTVVGKGNYRGKKVEQFSIGKCPVNPPAAPIELQYNGLQQTGIAANDLYAVSKGTGVDAKSYEATLTLRDARNYRWVDDAESSSRTMEWSIAPSSGLSLQCNDVSSTFSGNAISGIAIPSDYAGTTVEYSIDGESWSATAPTRTIVGETIVLARATSSNYVNTASCTYRLTIVPKLLDVPSAHTGLVYEGVAQTGVSGSDLYRIENGSATGAGSYTAVAKLLDSQNYRWADGSTADKQIGWSIARRNITIAASPASKIAGNPDPSLSASADGLVDDCQFNCSLRRTSGELPGVYDIVVSGAVDQGSYHITYANAKFTILENKSAGIGKGAKSSTTAKKTVKLPNTMKVTVKTRKVILAKVRKAKQVVSGAIIVKNAKGTVTYTKVAKGSDKKLSINKKTGKITVAKGTKKGKHKIKVKVTAAGNKSYKALSKTVVATINVG